MHGSYDADVNYQRKATITVNGRIVQLTEPIPYDEPASWKTKTIISITHVNPVKVQQTHKALVTLLTKGDNTETNLVELWRELKRQYNAVLDELLTPEASLHIVLVMHMFSERGHESYKREVTDGRFAKILILLFEQMSKGEIKSSEVSFIVSTESDEKMTSPSASPSILSDTTSEFLYSESIALGGYEDDTYGSVQILSGGSSPEPSQSSIIECGSRMSQRSGTSPFVMRIESGAQTNGALTGSSEMQPLHGAMLQQIKTQIDSSLSRKISDVKNTQEKERMELLKRFDKMEKIINQNQQTTELMQASQKRLIDEGLQKTNGSLQNLMEKMDDMERFLETRIQEMREPGEGVQTEKVQDLTHEVKDLRRDFSKFQYDTSDTLHTLSRDLSHVKESLASIQETFIEMKQALSNIPQPSYQPTSQPSHPLHTSYSAEFSGPQVQPYQPLQTPYSTEFSGPRVQSSSHFKPLSLHSASASSSSEGTTTPSVHPIRETNTHTIKLSEFKSPSSQREGSEKQQESPYDRSNQSDIEKREGLNTAFSHAEELGLFSDDNSDSKDEGPVTKGDGWVPVETMVDDNARMSSPMEFPDVSLSSSGTLPISKSMTLPSNNSGTMPTPRSMSPPSGVVPAVSEDTIVSLAEKDLQIDQAFIIQANEMRMKYDLPLSLDVVKVVAQAFYSLSREDFGSVSGRNIDTVVSEGGIDTVLCIDLSGSVDDKAKEQVISVLSDFLTDAEDLSVERDLSENIGVVVFGTKTEILSPLTVDYSGVLEKLLGDLQTGGSSPLHTALVLCSILMEKGGPMSVGGYIVPPRIVVFSDGRPTDDTDINNALAEYGTKPPQIGEKVKWMVNQLHHHGYTIFSVPIGAQVNRAFLHDIASLGGGRMVDLADVRYIKKYFLYQVTAGHVIQRCHEIGDASKCSEMIQTEVHTAKSGLDEGDIIHIRDIIDKSKELEDKEYHDLPPLGTRVQVKSGEASADPMTYGTVVQNLPDGWIKVQLDDGMINYYHYGNGENEDVKIVHTPNILGSDQMIGLGVCVRQPEHKMRLGMTFRLTNSGFVDVRWEDGIISRHKYGADGEFSLEIVPQGMQVYPALSKGRWQWCEDEQWKDFNEENQEKLEKSFQTNKKTCSLLFQNESVRVNFEKRQMRLSSKDKFIPVRRLES